MIGKNITWRSQGQGTAWATKWGKIIGSIDKGQSLFKKFPQINKSNSAGGDTAKIDRWVVEVTKKKNNAGQIQVFKKPKYYTPPRYQKFQEAKLDNYESWLTESYLDK